MASDLVSYCAIVGEFFQSYGIRLIKTITLKHVVDRGRLWRVDLFTVVLTC